MNLFTLLSVAGRIFFFSHPSSSSQVSQNTSSNGAQGSLFGIHDPFIVVMVVVGEVVTYEHMSAAITVVWLFSPL